MSPFTAPTISTLFRFRYLQLDSIKIEAHESEITHGQNLLYNYQFDEVFHSHPQVAFGMEMLM